jgi:hypothetical protein
LDDDEATSTKKPERAESVNPSNSWRESEHHCFALAFLCAMIMLLLLLLLLECREYDDERLVLQNRQGDT